MLTVNPFMSALQYLLSILLNLITEVKNKSMNWVIH